MSRQHFIQVLKDELSALSIVEQQQIIDEYESIFEIKMEAGVLEEDVISELGDPKQIARNFIEELNINEDNSQYYNKESVSQPQYSTSDNSNKALFILAIIFDLVIGFWLYFSFALLTLSFVMVSLVALLGALYSILSLVSFFGLYELGEVFTLIGISCLFGALSYTCIRGLKSILVRHTDWLRGLM